MKEVLIIYTDRETGLYSTFDKIPITPQRPLEKVQELLETYNHKEDCKTVGKIYTDPVLLEFASDVYATKTRRAFINDLKDAFSEMESALEDVKFELDELRGYFGVTEEEED